MQGKLNSQTLQGVAKAIMALDPPPEKYAIEKLVFLT